jgi:hypothetical protein
MDTKHGIHHGLLGETRRHKFYILQLWAHLKTVEANSDVSI